MPILLLILLVPQLIPFPHSLFLIKTSRSQCGPEYCHFLFIDDNILWKVTGHLFHLPRDSKDTIWQTPNASVAYCGMVHHPNHDLLFLVIL